MESFMLAAILSGPSRQALALAITTIAVARAEVGALNELLSAERFTIRAFHITTEVSLIKCDFLVVFATHLGGTAN